MDPTFCIGDIWCGLGFVHILLWVLTFAIVFGLLRAMKAFGDNKKVSALVSIVLAFFVIIAVPTTVIAVVSGLSNSLIVLAIGLVIVMALLGIVGVSISDTWKKWIAILIALIAIAVFAGAGGLSLIGLGSLPALGTLFSTGTWVLILMGIAVLWMLSEDNKQPAGH